jgi:hypothetical protein
MVLKLKGHKMIKNNHKSFIIIIFIFLITASSISFGKDFPPDNAAVLYLRAFILYEEPENEDLSKMITDLQDGKIKPNDEIRNYFKKNQRVIELITTASQIPYCNWGQDHSKGFDLMMPELATARKLAFLLVADSKISLADGDYKASLEKCLTIHRMARHVGNDLMISNLVGIAMNSLANKHIKIILSEMPDNVETLEWLKSQMLDISSNTPSLISAMDNESKISIKEMRPGNLDEFLDNPEAVEILKSLSKEQIEEIRNGDEAFFEEDRKYYLDYIASAQAAFALPYEDAYNELIKLNDKIVKDVETNTVAFFTSTISSSMAHIYTGEIYSKTSMNAFMGALDIYIQKAKTGHLPDELPEGLPKDMFSGKDFMYEKTEDGFILRCQGKDLEKDKFNEYEFKVKK